MAYIIQITIPGGMYLGPEKDTLQAISNSDKYECKETINELTQLINSK